MRKHSARKWLHFILDLLPVIILPVFAIYEINHDQNEPITVTDGAWEHRPLYQTNEVNNTSDLIEGNIYDLQNGYLYPNETEYEINIVYGENLSYSTSDFQGSIQTENYNANEDNFIKIKGYYVNNQYRYEVYLTNEQQNFYMSLDEFSYTKISFVLINGGNNLYNFLINEELLTPTKSDFNVIEYVYNENHVYDNTDIGSQMMYALYKPVKEYFNFNNVFNFGDIYNWFELNIFGGTAPMSFFIVWNIVLYQFVMDLVFLIYGLFMWFIDMCEKLMDKPLNSIK